MLRESAVGHLIDINPFVYQSQLLHHVFVKEFKQPSLDEIWFCVGEKRIRFSMAEFGLITGLKCVGDSDFSSFAQVENGMCDRYFPDQTVKYGDIKDRCTVKYKNDVLVVKFAKLHLIVNFLLSKDKDKPVDTELINLICSDECDDFSWGKLAFETTFPYLRKGAKGKNLKNTIYAKKSKVLKGKKPSFLYKLEGCSWVFHVWIYACIKKLKDKDICQCLPNSPFRICRWKNSSLPTGCSLDRSIFGSSKFVVDNCIPTTAEMKKFKLSHFPLFPVLLQLKNMVMMQSRIRVNYEQREEPLALCKKM
ncbi:uncharacterized protein LOC133792175 isoform X2 [Humulus lupulus]|nr:uncharacterized protein LOC133792175 isoform X2 [Humulus lupulus]